jgi:hypothetical protein
LSQISDDKSGGSKKRFWILTVTLLASIGCFSLSAWGFFGSVIAVVFGLFLFIPGVEDQFDVYIYSGLFGGALFLAVFFVLRLKLK